MPWQPEDWNDLPVDHWVASRCEPHHVLAVRELLHALPGREQKTIAVLCRGRESLALVSTSFGRLLTLDPELSIQDVREWAPFTASEPVERLVDGLRRAGLPE